MTTIIDPGTGGEAAVFNKSGTAILNVALTDSFTMIVPAVAGRVIVNIDYTITGPDPLGWTPPVFTTDSAFEIGDEIWIFSLFAPRPTHRIPSAIVDTAGNPIIGGMSYGIIKVANNAETLITDGESAQTNWKTMSVI